MMWGNFRRTWVNGLRITNRKIVHDGIEGASALCPVKLTCR